MWRTFRWRFERRRQRRTMRNRWDNDQLFRCSMSSSLSTFLPISYDFQIDKKAKEKNMKKTENILLNRWHFVGMFECCRCLTEWTTATTEKSVANNFRHFTATTIILSRIKTLIDDCCLEEAKECERIRIVMSCVREKEKTFSNRKFTFRSMRKFCTKNIRSSVDVAISSGVGIVTIFKGIELQHKTNRNLHIFTADRRARHDEWRENERNENYLSESCGQSSWFIQINFFFWHKNELFENSSMLKIDGGVHVHF